MNDFLLRILETDEDFYNGRCTSLVVPTTEGMYGIMANHTNLFAALAVGLVKYTTTDGENHYIAVSGGMIKVENNEVLILADSAETPESIDETRAEDELNEAKAILAGNVDVIATRNAEAMMQRAINRLKIRKRYGIK